MAKKKQPYIPLYTGDYIKDTRTLSLEAKGAWMDIILFMWSTESGGIIEGNMEEFARMVGTTEMNFVAVLNELCRKKICDVHGDQTKIFKIVCRRLVREAEISDIRRDAVQTRYKTPSKDSTKTIQKSDNDIDNDNGIEFKYELKENSENLNQNSQNVPRETVSADEMTNEWFESMFGERYMETLTFPYRDVKIYDEFEKFKVKVRGAPDDYGSRDTTGMRNAFLYHLNQVKPGKPVKIISQDRMEQFKNLKA